MKFAILLAICLPNLPLDEAPSSDRLIASFLGKTDAVDESRLPGRVLFDYVRFYERVQ